MKVSILSFTLLLTFAAGCKKEKSTAPVVPPPAPPVADTGRIQLLNIGEYRFRVDTNGTEFAKVDKFSSKIINLKTGVYQFEAIQLEGIPYGKEFKKTIEIEVTGLPDFVFP